MRRRPPPPEGQEAKPEAEASPSSDPIPDNHGRIVRDVAPGPAATVKHPGAHVDAEGNEISPYNQIHEAAPVVQTPMPPGQRPVEPSGVPTHQIGAPAAMRGAKVVSGHSDPRAVPGTPQPIYRITGSSTPPQVQQVDARQTGPSMNQRFTQPNQGAVRVGGTPTQSGMVASVLAVPGDLNSAQAAALMAQATGQPQQGVRSQFQGRPQGPAPGMPGGKIAGLETVLQQNAMATIGLADEATQRRELEAAGLSHRMPSTTLQRRGEPEPSAPSAAAAPSAPVVDVTVILSAFGRPHLLQGQLDALRQGTRIPAMVVVLARSGAVEAAKAIANGAPWAPGALPHTTYGLPVTPWERFRIASRVATSYVAILDDDCIPGPGWLEACVAAMEGGMECAIAAAGARWADDGAEVGYRGPSTDEGSAEVIASDMDEATLPAVVDVGEGGWFLRREWMSAVGDVPVEEPPYGWQIHVSAALASAGIPTVVLPYGADRATWGSLSPALGDGLRKLPDMDQLRAHEFATYRSEGWALVSSLPEQKRVIWPKGQEPLPPGVYFNKRLDRLVSPTDPEWSAEHYELLTGKTWEPPAEDVVQGEIESPAAAETA